MGAGKGRLTMIKAGILRMIAKTDDAFVEKVLSAAIARKRELHPDWEIRYLAQPKAADEKEQERYERAWRALTGEP